MASFPIKGLGLVVLLVCLLTTAAGQTGQESEGEFGPVVSAYLGYLKNEQEVVDDRVSRREISATYYRRNSNRIRALRQMAIKLARDSHNDYLPELEAVAATELGILFEKPPQLTSLRVGTVLQNTFRYLGSVRSGEIFYVFARLDPYEQSELKEKSGEETKKLDSQPSGTGPKSLSRTRRVTPSD
jgi:hypothetical protein